ncbi:MAG: hypothetical protein ABH864_00745 [archaeon]
MIPLAASKDCTQCYAIAQLHKYRPDAAENGWTPEKRDTFRESAITALREITESSEDNYAAGDKQAARQALQACNGYDFSEPRIAEKVKLTIMGKETK